MAGVRVGVRPGGEMCCSTGGEGGSDSSNGYTSVQIFCTVPPSRTISSITLNYFPALGCWLTVAVIGGGSANRTRGICEPLSSPSDQLLLSVLPLRNSFSIPDQLHFMQSVDFPTLNPDSWREWPSQKSELQSHARSGSESQRLLLRYVCTQFQKCIFLIQ